MDNQHLSIRPLSFADVPLIADYWLNAPADFLEQMGADPQKIPKRELFTNALHNQLQRPLAERQSYALIWLKDNVPIGHSNLNPFTFGQSGFMHLHLWSAVNRGKGVGEFLAKESVKHYFKNLHLTELYSEPYALNEAPNKTLKKIGFTLEKRYCTVPGSINFEQDVNRWRIAPSEIKDKEEI